MRVYLRNTDTGLYYAGSGQWVPDLSGALDLGEIEYASQLACEENLAEAEMVLSYDNPACQLALPVRPEWHGGSKERVAA
jgi:hypothetical protein